jgi:hypothetical protein
MMIEYQRIQSKNPLFFSYPSRPRPLLHLFADPFSLDFGHGPKKIRASGKGTSTRSKIIHLFRKSGPVPSSIIE